jgi:hypothetical protein
MRIMKTSDGRPTVAPPDRAPSGGTSTMTSKTPTAHERTRRTGRRGGERGAALIEFAIIMPILFLLIFAVIEFGWTFFQNLDVRHAAREGGRLAAVDYRSTAGAAGDTQRDQIIAEICDRMDDEGAASVGFHRTGSADVGQEIVVTVELDLGNGLTGFLAPFLPETLDSQVSTRIEQPAQWSSMPVAVKDSDGSYVASGGVTACP